ncbi:MAG: ORF6N domain-containing protein [Endomicrobium sp.]|jgi:phage regulator Rha-like protein|nr:ORF6N domain-containing protein [Endomicrobium sp.]
MSKDEITVIDNNLIKSKIINIRNQPVILDRDVAEIYGVETKVINQAVKLNPDKFPDNYIIELSLEETNLLRSKILTIENDSRGKHSKYEAKAFTERGLYMLATILKSKRATEMTIQIINTFTELRNIARELDNAGNTSSKEEMGKSLTIVGNKLTDLLLDNMEHDTVNIKTELELNLGILRIKKTTETTKNNTKK